MTFDELIRKNNSFWTEDRSLTALLVYVIINIFLILPFSYFRAGELSFAVIYSFILLSGVFAIGKTLRTKVLVLSLAVAAFATQWVSRFQPTLEIRIADNAFGLLFFLVLIIAVIRHIFREGDVNIHRIQGAVAVYLLVGVVFSRAYHIIYLLDNSGFTMPPVQSETESFYSRFVYFSYVTLTTLGFGDITAVNPVAKSLVMLEGLVGQLFPAIMITRLVTLEIEHRKRRSA